MRTVNAIFILVGTFVMTYIMGNIGAPLRGPGTDLGIIDLEFAFIPERATSIFQNWNYSYAGGITRTALAIRHTWLDFVYIFFYACFFFLSNKAISAHFSGWVSTLGKWAAMAALYAGLFDIIENLGLLCMLNGFTGAVVPALTGIFSVLKWTLIFFSIFFMIVFGIISLFRKKMKDTS